MKIVVDTNIFLAAALNEPEKRAIVSVTTGHELIAPEILPFEIGNALSAMVKRSRLNLKEALSVFDAIEKIPVELRSIDIREATEIAIHKKIYAYDAYFLVCSLSLQSPLLTLDQAMKKVASDLGVKLLEVAI